MPVEYGRDSAYSKERQKWEMWPSEWGTQPGRPFHQFVRDFPKRMYKAGRTANGQTSIVDAADASDPDQQAALESRGFVAGGQGAAIDAFRAVELEQAKLHAELAYEAQRMSDGAQREYAEAEANAGARHLATVPETPIRKRGPKPAAA